MQRFMLLADKMHGDSCIAAAEMIRFMLPTAFMLLTFMTLSVFMLRFMLLAAQIHASSMNPKRQNS